MRQQTLETRDLNVALQPPSAKPNRSPSRDVRIPAQGSDEQVESRMRACVERIARHEEQALAELYDATVGRTYGTALRIVSSPQVAEEVVSDVYFQVWREAHCYDRDRALVQSWLLMLCRSRALDALRRRDVAMLHPEPQSLAGAPAFEQADLQDLLEATERGSKVRAALATLDPLPRQLLALAFFRGCSHSEIALQFAMPLGTVKSKIRQALQRLHDTLLEE